MKKFKIIGMTLVMLAATLLAAQPAAAAPDRGTALTRTAATSTLKAGFKAAACPSRGQQVKTSSSATVYLVGPNWDLYAIPGNVYFNLWDSWQPISTNDNLFVDCYWGYYMLNNAHLAKTSTDATVWIYDASYGAYRAITYAAFIQYKFSWSKIRVQSVSPTVSDQWNN
jgi:hypothetical protein